MPELDDFLASWKNELAAKAEKSEPKPDPTAGDEALARLLAEGGELPPSTDDGAATAAVATAAEEEPEVVVEALAEVDYSSSSTSSSESEEDLRDLVVTTATKQLMLHKLPRILNLHLKRFAHTLTGLRKISLYVKFPALLDLQGFCDRLPNGTVASGQSTLYRLVGTVQHMGSMGGGHYVAYAETRTDQWAYFSDSAVRPVSIDEVLKSEAYILFYEQVNPPDFPADFISYHQPRKPDGNLVISDDEPAPAPAAAPAPPPPVSVSAQEDELAKVLALSLLIQ